MGACDKGSAVVCRRSAATPASPGRKFTVGNNSFGVAGTTTNSSVMLEAGGTNLGATSSGTTSGGLMDNALGGLTGGLCCTTCAGNRGGLSNGIRVTRKLATRSMDVGMKSVACGSTSKRKRCLCAPTGSRPTKKPVGAPRMFARSHMTGTAVTSIMKSCTGGFMTTTCGDASRGSVLISVGKRTLALSTSVKSRGMGTTNVVTSNGGLDFVGKGRKAPVRVATQATNRKTNVVAEDGKAISVTRSVIVSGIRNTRVTTKMGAAGPKSGVSVGDLGVSRSIGTAGSAVRRKTINVGTNNGKTMIRMSSGMSVSLGNVNIEAINNATQVTNNEVIASASAAGCRGTLISRGSLSNSDDVSVGVGRSGATTKGRGIRVLKSVGARGSGGADKGANHMFLKLGSTRSS